MSSKVNVFRILKLRKQLQKSRQKSKHGNSYLVKLQASSLTVC